MSRPPSPAPADFSSLPLDLLPTILSHLNKRQDLRTCTLVSRTWNRTATPLLYRWVRIFGKDLNVLPDLFEMLASTPRLAQMVRVLEVRVYKKSYKVEETVAMNELAVRVLEACRNVESLTWTRIGSVTDDTMDAIAKLRKLKHLELNGHTNLSPGSWSATKLLDLPPLCSLSLILPDRPIAATLPAFFQHQQDLANASPHTNSGLSSLSILSRESAVITPALVKQLAPALARTPLTRLAIAGCPKLNDAAALELLSVLPGLIDFALEASGVTAAFYREAAPRLSGVRSLKFTHPGPRYSAEFQPALIDLIASTTRLEAFTLYHSGVSSTATREWVTLDADGGAFVRALVAHAGARLRKLELSNVLISLDSVEVLAAGMPRLRDLVVHVGGPLDVARLSGAVARLPELRTLHVLSARAEHDVDAFLAVAREASATLRQVGYRNRVWTVKRTYDGAVAEPEEFEDWQNLPGLRFVETAEAFGAFRRARYGAEEDADSD